MEKTWLRTANGGIDLRDNSTNPRTDDLSENWALTDEIGRMRKNINTAPGKISKETFRDMGEKWRKILDALPAHLEKDAEARADFADEEMQEAIDALLKIERPRLAPPQFQRLKTVVLLELAGFKPGEIAERLGLSKSTVDQALFDAQEAMYHIKAKIDNDYRTATGQLDRKTRAVFMKWRADHSIANPK